jgi:hypothetical protein
LCKKNGKVEKRIDKKYVDIEPRKIKVKCADDNWKTEEKKVRKIWKMLKEKWGGGGMAEAKFRKKT